LRLLSRLGSRSVVQVVGDPQIDGGKRPPDPVQARQSLITNLPETNIEYAMEIADEPSPTNIEADTCPLGKDGTEGEVSIPQPEFTCLATGAEMQDLIILHADLVTQHINKKFASPTNKVELFTSQILKAGWRAKCTSPGKFHSFFDLWAPRELGDAEDVMFEVGAEVNNFNDF
jgi:hypothetical protein